MPRRGRLRSTDVVSFQVSLAILRSCTFFSYLNIKGNKNIGRLALQGSVAYSRLGA